MNRCIRHPFQASALAQDDRIGGKCLPCICYGDIKLSMLAYCKSMHKKLSTIVLNGRREGTSFSNQGCHLTRRRRRGKIVGMTVTLSSIAFVPR